MLRLPPHHALRRPVTPSMSSDSVTVSDPLSSPPLRFPAGSLAWKPSKSGYDPESGNNSATKRFPSIAAISSSTNSNFPSSVYITPPVAVISSPAVSLPSRRRLLSLRRRFFSRPHHLFNVFLKVRHVRSLQNFAMLAKERWRTSIRIYSMDT